MTTFTDKIRDLHDDLATTQRAAAARFGVTEATYSRWITGKAEARNHQRRKIEREVGLARGALGRWVKGQDENGR